MLLNNAKSHLLIVDVQEKLLPAVQNKQQTIAKLQLLARMAREVDVPITISEQYPKGLGPTVSEVKEVAGNQAVVGEKIFFSCHADDGLRERFEAIKENGRDHIVITGLEAHVCVLQSAIELKEAGYGVSLVEDAISARDLSDKKRAVERALTEDINVITAEMAAFEWVEKAGTPAFKTLSSMLKEQS